MGIVLTPEQISAAVAEDATRGMLPGIVAKVATSGELYRDLNDNTALVAKYTGDDGVFDSGKLRNATKQAIKNATSKAAVAGATFPELLAVVQHGENGDGDHVLIVNSERLAEAQTSENGEL
jgi:hypothetical protein